MIHTMFTFLKDTYSGCYHFNLSEENLQMNYENLVWTAESPKPSKAEIVSIVEKLNQDEPIKLLRQERNRLLAETDMYGLEDFPFKSQVDKTTWRQYRQALRSMTETASPTLTANGELDVGSITWPTRP